MKLNKLILPIAIITPLFASSCKGNGGSGGKYTDFTIDAYEMIYAYSQTCSTTLTISDSHSDVEFVDDFKSEYFTFDNADDIKGKTYTINKTSSKKLTITFTGAYTGVMSQTESKKINYKINKSAFKNNVLINDATGNIAMTWDYLRNTSQQEGKDAIALGCVFTSSTGGSESTKASLNTSLPTDPQDIKKYCSVSGVSGTISFKRKSDEGDATLIMSLTGLPNDEQAHKLAFNIHNTTDAIIFNNLPDGYGVTFNIEKAAGSEECYSLLTTNMYFDKAR